MLRSYKTYENETKLGQMKLYMNHRKIPITSDLVGQEQFSDSCHQEQDQRRDAPASQSQVVVISKYLKRYFLPHQVCRVVCCTAVASA